ncbi:angiotensinogen [Pelobates fuscus]|uniref:angiotensinogen n=1 Tax=Pelobates fuscus TaxID=191477 RepID=UPI002FE49C51
MKVQIILLHLAAYVAVSVCNRVYVHPFNLFNFNKTECEKAEKLNHTIEKLFIPISIDSKIKSEEELVKEKTSFDVKHLGITGNYMLNRLTYLMNDFGFRALNALMKMSKDDTFLLSYTNLYATMISFYLGASGDTSDDLQTILGFLHSSGHADCASKVNGLKVLSTLRNIDNLLFSKGANIDALTIACIFVAPDVPLSEMFVQNLLPSADELYVRSVDFTNSIKAAELINDFLESRTSKKNQNVLKSTAESTNLLYTSYIHFTGKVNNSFLFPEPQDFWIEPNRKILVPMLSVSGTFQYKTDDTTNQTVLKLPISENDFLLLVQPTNGNTLENIESSISWDTFQKWLNNLSNRKINLSLPKLEIESSYDIQEILAKLGVPSLLGNTANFRKISNVDIQVGQIINKVNFELESIALDTSEAKSHLSDKDDIEPLEVKYNEPFLLAVFEGTTKAFIFIGRITNPVNAL